MSEEEVRKGKVMSDVEEVRGILSAVTEFIEKLKEPIKDLINLLMTALDGAKLGEDVGAFYSNLIKSGIPKELAQEMTKDYLKHRLESAPSLRSLTKIFSEVMSKKKPRFEISKVDEALKTLEELKELKPEVSEKLDKIIDLIKKLKEGKGMAITL